MARRKKRAPKTPAQIAASKRNLVKARAARSAAAGTKIASGGSGKSIPKVGHRSAEKLSYDTSSSAGRGPNRPKVKVVTVAEIAKSGVTPTRTKTTSAPRNIPLISSRGIIGGTKTGLNSDGIKALASQAKAKKPKKRKIDTSDRYGYA